MSCSSFKSKSVELKILNKEFIKEFGIPGYASEEAAAMDFRAAIPKEAEVIIAPGESVIIPTGIAIDINDPNIALNLIPRSGLGVKRGLVLGNLVGCIDSDYQGEIGICVWNRHKSNIFSVIRGARICQGQFVPIIRVVFDIVEEFSRETSRGSGGFGSTGTS